VSGVLDGDLDRFIEAYLAWSVDVLKPPPEIVVVIRRRQFTQRAASA